MYEWDPDDYHANSSAQLASAHELIKRLNLKGDEAVLDIGCGDGKITAQIAGLVPRGMVTGIDASGPMIEFAALKFPTASHPNLRFAVMDAREITFENQFDLVFSNAALHWVQNHGPVLQGIRRCLKPGGKMYLQMVGKGGLAPMIRALLVVLADSRWNRHFQGFQSPNSFYGPEPDRQFIMDAGLEPLRVELVSRTMTQKGRAGLTGWLRTTWMPVLSRVPSSEGEEFLGRIVDEFLKANPLGPDGLASIEVMRLVAEARKP